MTVNIKIDLLWTVSYIRRLRLSCPLHKTTISLLWLKVMRIADFRDAPSLCICIFLREIEKTKFFACLTPPNLLLT